MKIIFVDTEGNGDGSNEQICQLSYLVFTDGVFHSANYYFPVDTMNPHAYKVHRLSKKKLMDLSGGRTFSDCVDFISNDFLDCDYIVGHNIKSDIALLRSEFQRCNISLRYKSHLCTMRYFNNALKLVSKTGSKRYPKLSELCLHYGISDASVQIMCDLLFGSDTYKPHDARFDVTAVYMCIQAAKKNGDIKGVI